jgi:hypothetical protein
MKKYSFKDHPEHEKMLKPWSDKWIANAMSTNPMNDEERFKLKEAVKGLYKSANLIAPPDNRIIFVPSPFVLRFAGGFSAAIWHKRGKSFDAATYAATRAATYAATRAATYAATRAATGAATYAATGAATYAATRAATYAATRAATGAATCAATCAATYAATRAATCAATYAATCAATYAATRAATGAATGAATRAATRAATGADTYTDIDDATYAATNKNNNWFNLDVNLMARLSSNLGLGKFGLECASKIYMNCYQGGNQWSGWTAFLTFFRHIAKLPLDYSKFEHWETLSVAGPRIMHKEFCMISERPEVLLVDEQNRPHCETGPFCRWRDGTALYAWHGIYIPCWWIEDKKSLTPEIALKWENVEQRRSACEVLGWVNVLEHPSLNSKIINEDLPHIGTLIEIDLPDAPKQWFLKYQCGTGRFFAESVNDKKYNTALKANAAGNGWRGVGNPEDYIPFIRT